MSLKEAAAVTAAILVNAFILTQLVGGVSSNQPTAAFAQPYDSGQPCIPDTPGQCVSGICAPTGDPDLGICCETACNGTSQTCNQPGNEGTCLPVIPAPSMSLPGQFLAATLLTLLGWFGLRRMRRLD